jgi:hypothetical protein
VLGIGERRVDRGMYGNGISMIIGGKRRASLMFDCLRPAQKCIADLINLGCCLFAAAEVQWHSW